jgi:signal transduction histidine kinase
MIRAPWPDAYRDDVAWARVLAGRGFDLLVVGLAVVSEVEIWVSDVPGPTWVLAPGVLLYTLPLLFRRRFPFLAPVFVFGVHIAISFADPHAAGSTDTGSVALLLAFWAMGAGNDGQLAIAGLGIGLGTLAIIAAEDDRVDVTLAINSGIVYGLAGLFALLLARRSRRALAAEQRATQLERDQHERARAAVGDERARIAREMHDVLAHRVSLLSLHAGALEFHPDASAEEVAEAAAVIRASAHAALEELRDVIGVLREGAPAGAPEPPQPTLAEIPALVEESRLAGMRVHWHIEVPGDAALPAALGRAAYRIVQEGLTNARKHAPGAAVEVTIDAQAGTALVVEVLSRRAVGVAAPAALALPGAGTGLVGLAERVALAGGELEHGPDGAGDFVLRATLPWSA